MKYWYGEIFFLTKDEWLFKAPDTHKFGWCVSTEAWSIVDVLDTNDWNSKKI